MRTRLSAIEQGSSRSAESSQSMTLTVPAIPPNIIRLRSPPISERATDGSSDGGGKAACLPAPMPPVVPFGSRSSPESAKQYTKAEGPRTEETRRRTASFIPLTTDNLTQYQEEIGSAVQEPAPDISSNFDTSISGVSQNEDSSKHTDPFEWTKKFVEFKKMQREGAGKRPEEDRKLLLRQLAEPLNHGKGLPSATTAIELINEQIMKESTMSKRSDEIDYDRLWGFTKDIPAASQNQKIFSVDRWSGQPEISSENLQVERPHFEVPYSRLGKQTGTPSQRLPPEELHFHEYPEDMGVGSSKPRIGKLPLEMMNHDPETDAQLLEAPSDFIALDVSGENQAPFMFGETSNLQAMMSNQIENDLASGGESDYGGDASTYETKSKFSGPSVPMTIKFALPEASEEEVARSAEYFKHPKAPACEPTSSETLAGRLKRKHGQHIHVNEVTVKRPRIGTSERCIHVGDSFGDDLDDASDSQADSLFDERRGVFHYEMSGALQDMESTEGEDAQANDSCFEDGLYDT